MANSEFYNWTSVDSSINPIEIAEYLEQLNELSDFIEYKNKSYQLLRIQSGQQILDVGCGIGFDVKRMSSITGKSGKVVGLDSSITILKRAKELSFNWPFPIEFINGTIYDLPFQNQSFDGVRVDRVFQHLENLTNALDEVKRIINRDGIIVLCEPDWETLSIDSDNQVQTRRITNFLTHFIPNKSIGSQLQLLCEQALFKNIESYSYEIKFTDLRIADKALGISRKLSVNEISNSVYFREWFEEMEIRQKEGTFLAHVKMFIVKAQKE